MRVLIFGASGRTGRELVAAALDAGHEVRAFVRNPADIGAWSPRLQVVTGDATVWGQVGPAMRDVSAVLSALGTGSSRAETKLYSESVGAILWAMREHGVKRLVFMTSAGVIDDENEPFFQRTVLRYAMRRVIEDQQRAEERLRESDVEWTIVRPPRLMDGPRRGHYEVASERPVDGEYKISRIDVADFMVSEMVAKKFLRAAVGIGYTSRESADAQE